MYLSSLRALTQLSVLFWLMPWSTENEEKKKRRQGSPSQKGLCSCQQRFHQNISVVKGILIAKKKRISFFRIWMIAIISKCVDDCMKCWVFFQTNEASFDNQICHNAVRVRLITNSRPKLIFDWRFWRRSKCLIDFQASKCSNSN